MECYEVTVNEGEFDYYVMFQDLQEAKKFRNHVVRGGTDIDLTDVHEAKPEDGDHVYSTCQEAIEDGADEW